MNPVIEALDRIDHIAVCLEAVSDLTAPETDLHLVRRDKLSALLEFLLSEHRAASNQLAKAIRQQQQAL